MPNPSRKRNITKGTPCEPRLFDLRATPPARDARFVRHGRTLEGLHPRAPRLGELQRARAAECTGALCGANRQRRSLAATRTHSAQNATPLWVSFANLVMMSCVTGPGFPSPIGMESSEVIGMTSVAVPQKNASDAVRMSYGVRSSSVTS